MTDSPQAAPQLVYGCAVALGEWAVLLRGPSGSGKSDLALRLIHNGHTLIGDDHVELTARDRFVTVAPPKALEGLLEIRGLGIVQTAWRGDVPLALVVDLVAPDEVERMPDARLENFLGFDLPVLRLAPFEASAAAKVEYALKSLLS